jgi:hypothetical protein
MIGQELHRKWEFLVRESLLYRLKPRVPILLGIPSIGFVLKSAVRLGDGRRVSRARVQTTIVMNKIDRKRSAWEGRPYSQVARRQADARPRRRAAPRPTRTTPMRAVTRLGGSGTALARIDNVNVSS